MSDPEARSRRPWRTDAEWHRLRHRIDATADGAPSQPWRRYVAGLAAASVVVAVGYVEVRDTTHAPIEWRVARLLRATDLCTRHGDEGPYPRELARNRHRALRRQVIVRPLRS
jgi:hypothetical protein